MTLDLFTKEHKLVLQGTVAETTTAAAANPPSPGELCISSMHGPRPSCQQATGQATAHLTVLTAVHLFTCKSTIMLIRSARTAAKLCTV